jgi:hypothetical protein
MSTRSFGKCGFALAASFILISLGATSFAQGTGDQSSYMELSWMKVKQDKVAEFGQLSARIADANRRGKGDTWVAYTDMYGKDNYVWMASARSSLSDVEPAMNKFLGALKEFMGYSPDRFFAEASKTVESSGTQLWRHRYDLSWNLKDSPDWQAKLAQAHYVAVITVHVKPGHFLDAEKQVKMVSDAVTASGDKQIGLVSQVIMGGDFGTMFVRIPLGSVADIGEMMTARKALGEDGYRKYSEMAAQDYASVDYSLKRIMPEWSNPPASFVGANPAMWKVKPVVAAAKPKPAESAKAAQ